MRKVLVIIAGFALALASSSLAHAGQPMLDDATLPPCAVPPAWKIPFDLQEQSVRHTEILLWGSLRPTGSPSSLDYARRPSRAPSGYG